MRFRINVGRKRGRDVAKRFEGRRTGTAHLVHRNDDRFDASPGLQGSGRTDGYWRVGSHNLIWWLTDLRVGAGSGSMAATARPGLRADVFRLFGDHGADTLDRYFAQIDYTAIWCARMLNPKERVHVVIPEGVEDVVVVRDGRFEMRQMKSRDESVGPWSLTEATAILGRQYARSRAFGDRRFSFHFVSDGRADVKPNKKIGNLGDLKVVLDLHRDGMRMASDEATMLRLFRERLPTLIMPHVRPADGSHCDEAMVEQFLLETYIETNDTEFRTRPSLDVLHASLAAAQPNHPHRTVPELRAIYDQLLLLIVRRIREGTDIRTRAIRRSDVLSCCQRASAVPEQSMDFASLFPRKSKLEAKTIYGGFDIAEAKQFRQQLSRARVRRREMIAMHLGDRIDDLELALGELQRRERRAMSAETVVATPFGPALLERVRRHFALLATQHLPSVARPDEMLCQGLLWDSTQRCQSAWHPLPTAGPVAIPSSVTGVSTSIVRQPVTASDER